MKKKSIIKAGFISILISGFAAHAASIESGEFNVTGVRAQATGTFVAVYVDASLTSANVAGCPVADFILIDAGSTGGKNALATVLAAKTNAAQVSFFIDDANCLSNKFIQANSVFMH